MGSATLGMACLSPSLSAPAVTPTLCGGSRDQCSARAAGSGTAAVSGRAAQLSHPPGLARPPAWGLHSTQEACRIKAPLTSRLCVGALGDVARRPGPAYASAQSLSAEESVGPLVEEGLCLHDQLRSEAP